MPSRSAPDGKEDRLKGSFARYLRRAESLLGSLHFWWAVCIIVAGFHAWLYRQSMNSDGMTYVDMASAASHGGPKFLVSGMWSPGYPALISLAFFIFRPSPILEFPVVHFVNFAAFSFVLLSFTFFLKSWLAVDRDDPSSTREQPLVISFCFCVFLWFTDRFHNLESGRSRSVRGRYRVSDRRDLLPYFALRLKL